MVKAANRDIPSLLRGLDARFKAVLVYGRDEGLVRERADVISRHVVEDLSDPFNVVRPDVGQIKDDGALLADELAALSMMGGRRLVRVDGGTDSITAAVENALRVPKTGNLLVVAAGDLAPRSKLRKLFEGAKEGVAIACYGDDAPAVEALILEVLGAAGLKSEPAATAYLVENLGSDRAVTRGELDKLVLYKASDQQRSLGLADVQAIIGDSAALVPGEIAAAVTAGKAARLDQLLDRAAHQGQSPIGILRILAKRFQQMHLVRGLVDEGKSIDEAMKLAVPRMFYKEKDAFRAEVGRWSSKKLALAMGMVFDSEGDCKTTGLPDAAICARTCLRLAAGASRGH
jgi:DNA polymerase III subunit delta